MCGRISGFNLRTVTVRSIRSEANYNFDAEGLRFFESQGAEGERERENGRDRWT